MLKKGNETIEFTQLSQGEKCDLSLVCDIARRLSIANPGLENPLEGEGIILIDEVDLHLHPKWQSEVASRLMQAFPNCQFFLSIHSAIVLSDILKRQIIPISGGRRIDVAFEPYGKQANYILNSYFDMPYPRNQAVAQDIEQAFEADELATNTIKVFNLNEPSLKNRRKESMQMVRAMLKGGMQKEDIFSVLSSDGFVSAIEYELSFA